MALAMTQPLTEMSTRNISWGYVWPVRRADNLTDFMCRLSRNLRASTSWNPQGLSRTVMGLLYPLFRRIETCASDVCFAPGCSNGPFFKTLMETTLDALSMRFVTKFAIYGNHLG